MTVRRTVVGLVCALALGLRAGPGHGAELMPSQAERDAPLDISADSFSAVRDGWVTASGNVRVRQGDTQVTADQMRVNQATGEIVAEGGVILIRQGQARSYRRYPCRFTAEMNGWEAYARAHRKGLWRD